MVIEPMPDEFYARYQPYSHEELYAMLQAGSPQQVEALLTAWRSMEGTVSGFGATLRSDLARLREGWEGMAGREFDTRVGSVAAYAETLAAEYGAIHTGLLAMGSALVQALGQAEPADAVKDTTQTTASTGATANSVLGPLGTVLGGVIGGLMGHNQDQHAKEASRERMVLLVAGLAAEFRVAEYHIWPVHVPEPPANMPAARHVPDVSDDSRHRREEHDRDDDHHNPVPTTLPTQGGHHGGGHHGGHGHHGSPPPIQPAGGQTQPDPWGTAPAVVGAIGAGAVAGGIVAASDRHHGHGHGRSDHDGPTKISLGDHVIGRDGVVRTTMGIADTPNTGTGSVGVVGQYGAGQYGPGMGDFRAPTSVPLTGPTPGGGPGVVGPDGQVHHGPATSSLASGGTANVEGGGDTRPTQPPPPPVAGVPAAPATGGTTVGSATNPGTVGGNMAGTGASYTSPTYGSHSGAMPPGGPPAGPPGGEARSWMQEGRMTWRDEVQAPPPVLDEPTE